MSETTVDLDNSEFIRTGGSQGKATNRGDPLERYGNWTLPKGKLQEGETKQEAASS